MLEQTNTPKSLLFCFALRKVGKWSTWTASLSPQPSKYVSSWFWHQTSLSPPDTVCIRLDVGAFFSVWVWSHITPSQQAHSIALRCKIQFCAATISTTTNFSQILLHQPLCVTQFGSSPKEITTWVAFSARVAAAIRVLSLRANNCDVQIWPYIISKSPQSCNVMFSASNPLFGTPTRRWSHHRSRSLWAVMRVRCWNRGVSITCGLENVAQKSYSFLQLLLTAVFSHMKKLHLLRNVIFITSLHWLDNPLPVPLRHLCPSAVAIVLQWGAAVAVPAWMKGCFPCFFLPLFNYSPPSAP